MVVREFNLGNTKIRIHDDAVVTKSEVEEILKRCAEIATRSEENKQKREIPT